MERISHLKAGQRLQKKSDINMAIFVIIFQVQSP